MTPSAEGLPESLELRLTAVEHAGRDTNLYHFSRQDGGTLPPATAGSHVTLVLPNGMERQYSIILPGAALTEYVIGVKREAAGRGGSAFVHDKLRLGDIVTVRAPRNNFSLVENAPASLLIAGGIGVTPMIAIASRLLALGRAFKLHVAFRGADHAVLSKELDRLPNVYRHFDDVAGGFFEMAAEIAGAPRDAHLYCCGPTPMISTFLDCAKADGRDEGSLHVEYFSAPTNPSTDGSFVVELARSRRTLTVPPGKSILHVLQEAGVSVLSSCEEGVCGACEVKVLEGVPDHRDAVLSSSERKQGKSMMICCSGSLTDRLVLDL
jgi:tetrachlorobenzoquinone reductase